MTTQLMEEMIACERDIVAIRLKTEEKLLAQREKVILVQKKREELQEGHRKAMAEFEEAHEHNVKGVRLKAEQDLADAVAAKENAEKRRQAADAGALAAEEKARGLERQVKKLLQELESTRQGQEQRFNQAVDTANDKVRSRMAQADREVLVNSLQAANIQDVAFDSIEALQTEVRVKMQDLGSLSEERSRYKELYDVFVQGHAQRLSPEQFEKAKDDIIKAWHNDWLESTNNFSEASKAVIQRPQGPAPENRPRSVELCRRRAEERMTSPSHERMTSPCEPKTLLPPLSDFRPKTAP